jgi:hypothetical protein
MSPLETLFSSGPGFYIEPYKQLAQSPVDIVIGLTRKVQLFAGQFVLGQSILCLEIIINLIGVPAVLPGCTFNTRTSTGHCVFLHWHNISNQLGHDHRLDF